MNCEAGKATVYLDQWPRPIAVSERLPEFGEDVLVFVNRSEWSEGGYWQLGERTLDGMCGSNDGPCDITYWLPAPPKPE